MSVRIILGVLAALCGMLPLDGHPRSERLLRAWEFRPGHDTDAATGWQQVRIPHDWAIYGPFDRQNDLQVVAVEQNGEKEQTLKTGRTGGLPFIGKGSYRTTVSIPDTAGRSHVLLFDGAMSNARVRVNGREIAYWPYGYNSFAADMTPAAVPGENRIEVQLENFEKASRWYPGAGLYRNVHLISTGKVHIPVWGTRITTPVVHDDYAGVALEIAGEEPYRCGGTRFGGRPDVPPGFVWPYFEGTGLEDGEKKNRPLAFLAQFALNEMQPFDAEHLLPDHGVLSFFYEVESQPWGFDPQDAGCARVFWFEDASALAPVDVLHRAAAVLADFRDALFRFEEDPARFRQGKRTRGAVEDFGAQVLFDSLHELRERGLRDAEGLGGFGDAAGSEDGGEVAVGVGVHGSGMLSKSIER